MPRLPTESNDLSQSSSPATILLPRLRLLSATQASQSELAQSDERNLSNPAREQLLRGKQLLLQLKELSHARPPERLQQTLAMLSLAIRSVQKHHLSAIQMEEIRLVLDRVTHELNEQSQQQRREQVQQQRCDLLAHWIERAVHLAEWSLDPIRELARELQREYHHHAPPLHWYEGLPKDPPLWAAAHGLNSAQIVLRMLVRASTTSSDLFNALLAGLLHDAGMANLPSKVLAVQEAASSATRQQWRQHPSWTADRVRPVLHPEEFDVATAIAQHHERLDGSGYPLQLDREQLIPLGRQLAVADAYAALCQPRPHRPAHSPRAALQLLLKEVQAGRLDEAVVFLLLPWGLAPIGSVVELSDGTQAEVVAWGTGSGFGLDARPVLIRYPHRDRVAVVDLEQARQRHIVKVLTQQEIHASVASLEMRAS